MTCEVCNIEFGSKRSDAKYCSPKCRKEASRLASIVTDNVTLSEIPVTLKFKFTTKQKKDDPMATAKSRIREAVYWYDVPLSAVPVIQKDWPQMPEDMNGRQYFLWWKNEFEVNNRERIDKETGEILNEVVPELLNPLPSTGKLEYVGGPKSAFWGV